MPYATSGATAKVGKKRKAKNALKRRKPKNQRAPRRDTKPLIPY